jgi:hypothetical protein
VNTQVAVIGRAVKAQVDSERNGCPCRILLATVEANLQCNRKEKCQTRKSGINLRDVLRGGFSDAPYLPASSSACRITSATAALMQDHSFLIRGADGGGEGQRNTA